MRNTLSNLRNKAYIKYLAVILAITSAVLGIKALRSRFSVRAALANRRGESSVGQAVAILIAVVIGALLLAGLYMLFSDTILPTLTKKIKEMFDYRG